MTFQPKKLSLVGIALLVASIALIFLSKLAVNQVAFNLFLLSSFTDVAALNMYTLLFAVAGYVLMAAGAALFVYVAWRSRFVVDAPTVKRQLRVLIVAVAVLLVTLSLFCTQAASANSLATTGYYLATPYSPYDWLIGNFSSGSYYAINGSNWANMMTWPSPAPWSDYAGNSTQVIEAALAATTAGSVYLKEVPMDYGLTIPENVQVIESVNGLTRVFIDDAESQGSPYTVSVDTVQTTYYTVQDCADRYIISWTSTDVDTVVKAVNNVMPSNGGIVKFASGSTFTSSTGFSFNGSYVTYDLTGSTLKLADSSGEYSNLVKVFNARNVTIQGGLIDGNKDNQESNGAIDQYRNGVLFINASFCTVKDSEIVNCDQMGIGAGHSSDIIIPDFPTYPDTGDVELFIINNRVKNCGQDGIHLHGAVNSTIKDNIISHIGRVGIYSYYCNNLLVSNNQVTDINSISANYYGGSGIVLQYSNDSIIANNIVQNTNQSCISVLVSTGVNIKGNVLSYSTIDALIFLDRCLDTVASNNVGHDAVYGYSIVDTNNSIIGDSASLMHDISKYGFKFTNSSNNVIGGKYLDIMTSTFAYDGNFLDANSHRNVVSINLQRVSNLQQSALLVQGNYTSIVNCYMDGVDVNVHFASYSMYTVISNNVFWSYNADYFYESNSTSNIARSNWQNGAWVAEGLN